MIRLSTCSFEITSRLVSESGLMTYRNIIEGYLVFSFMNMDASLFHSQIVRSHPQIILPAYCIIFDLQ